MTRYGLIFLSFALACGLAAAHSSGAALGLLAWASLGFVLVSASYFTETPQLLGKRADGRLSPVTVSLCLPVLLLNYGPCRRRRALARDHGFAEREEGVVGSEGLSGMSRPNQNEPGRLWSVKGCRGAHPDSVKTSR